MDQTLLESFMPMDEQAKDGAKYVYFFSKANILKSKSVQSFRIPKHLIIDNWKRLGLDIMLISVDHWLASNQVPGLGFGFGIISCIGLTVSVSAVETVFNQCFGFRYNSSQTQNKLWWFSVGPKSYTSEMTWNWGRLCMEHFGPVSLPTFLHIAFVKLDFYI